MPSSLIVDKPRNCLTNILRKLSSANLNVEEVVKIAESNIDVLMTKNGSTELLSELYI